MNDLSITSIKVAVIIQEMVESEYAGVINTINPVTSNPVFQSYIQHPIPLSDNGVLLD